MVKNETADRSGAEADVCILVVVVVVVDQAYRGTNFSHH